MTRMTRMTRNNVSRVPADSLKSGLRMTRSEASMKGLWTWLACPPEDAVNENIGSQMPQFPAPNSQILRWFCLFAVLLLFADVAIAQLSPAQVSAELRRAMALESRRDLTGAIGIYQHLCEQHPERVDILWRLESALSRTGRYAEVAALLRQRVSAAPGDMETRLRLGQALFAMGKTDSAEAYWTLVLHNATTPTPFAIVADHYRRRNRDERAEQTYRRARITLKDAALFARELAELAERQVRYPDAVREYLIYVAKNPQHVPMVEARLRDFAHNGDQHAEVFDLLLSSISLADQNQLRLLVEYALPAGFAAQTLDLLLSSDAALGNAWTYLFRIARYSLDRDDPTTAIAAYRAVHARMHRADLRARAQLGLGRAHELVNRPADAQTHYNALITHYPNRPETDEARFRTGIILRDHRHDAAGAQQAFQNLIQTNRRNTWRYRALFALAEGHLQANSTDAARRVYRQIIAEKATAPEETEARFRLAELQFLSGQINAAQTLLDTVLKADVNRDIINDAIALSALLQAGQRADSTLIRAYARACLKLRQKDQKGALRDFETLYRDNPQCFLADRLLDHQAKIHADQERYPQAIQTYRTLITIMPHSPLCPAAQLAQGAIYDRHLGQYYDAQKAYETLIVDYPLSLEADVARERLRRLERKIQDLERVREAG